MSSNSESSEPKSASDDDFFWYEDEEGPVCVVCMDPPVAPTTCRHCNQMLGCEDCVKAWNKVQIADGVQRNCPYCRACWYDLNTSVKFDSR
ncbi:unnamed protein product [Bursaphelenchus xylophilus]|nr:unnamed protein product [Bursaphelenchus xylophilus]CAG9114008.1 unnamed protein product [Bursaphelenchus xylophilus]